MPPMPDGTPAPGELWAEAKGDGDRYRALLLQHGHLIPLKPGDKPEPLPCGWPHSAPTTSTAATSTTTPEERNDRLDGPIHSWFGLTYSNYLVLCRSMTQSMPVEWQERAVALFDELDGAFTNLDRAPAYIVTPAEGREYGDLTQAEYKDLGIGHSAAGSTVREAGDVYYDRDGIEHQPSDRVLVPIGADPVPHYNRGRTFIEATR